MGRSPGYRPKAAVRDEVLALRALLAECDSSQWQKAQRIMDHITSLLGKPTGPMNGKVEPRMCKVCGYFGHTKQWCPVLKEREERAMDRLLDEDRELRAKIEAAEAERAARPPSPPYNPYTDGQAATFNELRIPFTVQPDIGAIYGVRGEKHDGLWTYDSAGRVVTNSRAS